MKKLYRFNWNCGEFGTLESLFIAEEKDVEQAIDSEVYFGDVLGTNSAISGYLESGDLQELPISEESIRELEFRAGATLCGLNPLDYLYVEEDDIDNNEAEEKE